MSNNGSSIPNFDPPTDVTAGSTSTQVSIDYDADGMPSSTETDGIETAFTRDADERVTRQVFSNTANRITYGNLTYGYDADGLLTSKGGAGKRSRERSR